MAAARRNLRRPAVHLVIIAAVAVAALATMHGFATAFAGAHVGLGHRQAARDTSSVAVGFFGDGGEQKTEATSSPGLREAYAATDVTPADQAKEFWKNPTLQGAISFLMAASTVLDVAGFFTGEAGVGLGISEALGAVDASTVATEGQAAVEALAQSGDTATEAAQAVQEATSEGGGGMFDFLKGPSSK